MVASLAVAAPAWSIVNIEDMRPSHGATGLAGRVEIGLNGDSGNSERSEWRLATRLSWLADDRSETLLLVDTTYGQSQGRRNSNRAFVHLRRGVPIGTGRVGEGFAQIEKDEFARLRFRALAGGGLRLDVGEGQAIGIGAFRAWERLDDAGFGDARGDAFWRANVYWHVDRSVATGPRLMGTLYLQPRIGPLDDLRLLGEFACELPLLGAIDLRLGLEVVHDSRPPLGVGQTDVHYRTTFGYRF